MPLLKRCGRNSCVVISSRDIMCLLDANKAEMKLIVSLHPVTSCFTNLHTERSKSSET